MIRLLYRLASSLLAFKVFSSANPRRIGAYWLRRQTHKAVARRLRKWVK